MAWLARFADGHGVVGTLSRSSRRSPSNSLGSLLLAASSPRWPRHEFGQAREETALTALLVRSDPETTAPPVNHDLMSAVITAIGAPSARPRGERPMSRPHDFGTFFAPGKPVTRGVAHG